MRKGQHGWHPQVQGTEEGTTEEGDKGAFIETPSLQNTTEPLLSGTAANSEGQRLQEPGISPGATCDPLWSSVRRADFLVEKYIGKPKEGNEAYPEEWSRRSL